MSGLVSRVSAVRAASRLTSSIVALSCSRTSVSSIDSLTVRLIMFNASARLTAAMVNKAIDISNSRRVNP